VTPGKPPTDESVLLFEEVFFIVRDILIYTTPGNNVINLKIFQTNLIAGMKFLFDTANPDTFFLARYLIIFLTQAISKIYLILQGQPGRKPGFYYLSE